VAKCIHLLIVHWVDKGLENVKNILFLSFGNLDNFVQHGLFHYTQNFQFIFGSFSLFGTENLGICYLDVHVYVFPFERHVKHGMASLEGSTT
jgi:hypothetical protein